MTTDLQTIFALIIVVAVFGSFVYKWLVKRKQRKPSGSCGCDKNDCE